MLIIALIAKLFDPGVRYSLADALTRYTRI